MQRGLCSVEILRVLTQEAEWCHIAFVMYGRRFDPTEIVIVTGIAALPRGPRNWSELTVSLTQAHIKSDSSINAAEAWREDDA
jgi:hypothetical protein